MLDSSSALSVDDEIDVDDEEGMSVLSVGAPYRFSQKGFDSCSGGINHQFL